ncbi:hypothetical protein ABID58_007425 [Bradyrhizobium sp. S3.2.6]|uniref:hypothetical protein n=1 Tax=Bradyrhizobium sp. S3.2.6 TaxID=3156428 RepID=UPI00339A96B9
MTRIDHKIIFAALGFLAVILDNVPRDKQALRATSLAQLMEAFCAASVPDAFMSEAPQGARTAETEELLQLDIAELRDSGSPPMTWLIGPPTTRAMQPTRYESSSPKPMTRRFGGSSMPCGSTNGAPRKSSGP